jgi:hypothetical protein
MSSLRGMHTGKRDLANLMVRLTAEGSDIVETIL